MRTAPAASTRFAARGRARARGVPVRWVVRSRRRFLAPASALALVLAGCGDDVPGNIAITAPAAWAPALGELVALTPAPGLSLDQVASSAEASAVADVAPAYDAYRLILVDDPALPAEAYRLDAASTPRTWTVRAHDVLGAQYGVAAALEDLGFRWRHPFDPFVPQAPRFAPTTDGALGVVHAPEVRVRGLQLHTLHPIEAYFALHEPGADNLRDARRILDWLIKNRGNYVQWVPLDDLLDPARHAEWLAQARAIVDAAHARGVRVGLNVQLFGQSNLQQSFDLSDDKTGTVPLADEVAARLPLVLAGLPLDVLALSFGEFFGADPQRFIDAVDEVAGQLRALAPAVEMHAVVHVGATQRVAYMGQDLLYYFLVKYADPRVVPDIHTVMYYDLYEDAGGAYHHQDFAEHRQYLLDRRCAGQRAAYFPETAYWVAFDDSVPQYLPLYARSRWLDLARLDADAAATGCGPLDEHLLFSSGWEWGYWLGDVAALRASYARPADPRALFDDAYGPGFPAGTAALLGDLADAQARALIDQRLAAYVAGRDVAIDAGRQLDIVSQPDRVTFDDLVAADGAARDAFARDVLAPLASYGDALDGFAARLDRLGVPGDRWGREIVDGVAIDQARVRFVAAAYEAALAHLAGDAATARRRRDAAAALLAEGQAIVARRHADLHDDHGPRLTSKVGNATIYQYGYLRNADTLCYWQRELTQLDGLLALSSAAPQGCLY